MTQYYAEIDNKQAGPFNRTAFVAKMSSGEITPQTLIWKEDMEDWAAAGTVAGMEELFSKAPPPKTPEELAAEEEAKEERAARRAEQAAKREAEQAARKAEQASPLNPIKEVKEAYKNVLKETTDQLKDAFSGLSGLFGKKKK